RLRGRSPWPTARGAPRAAASRRSARRRRRAARPRRRRARRAPRARERDPRPRRSSPPRSPRRRRARRGRDRPSAEPERFEFRVPSFELKTHQPRLVRFLFGGEFTSLKLETWNSRLMKLRTARLAAVAWGLFMLALTSWPSPPEVPVVSAIPN